MTDLRAHGLSACVVGAATQGDLSGGFSLAEQLARMHARQSKSGMFLTIRMILEID